jgi:hypothetical protein
MSSPFAQKFLGKKPFKSNSNRQQKDYEAIGDEARKLEQKYSADRGDAPDYEARLMVQKELAKKKEVSNESPLNGAYDQGGGSMKYVSILPHIQKLQKSFTDLAINSEKNKFNKDLDKTDKDYTQKSVESRLFGKKKKSKKPVDIQDINVYEHDPGLDDDMII